MIDAILTLDVQDDFHAPRVGSDDIIKVFADAFAQQDLVANFLFIATRSLLLKQRERSDIIESLKPHEVGLHTPSNAHPWLPEYAARKDWFEALEETERRETEGANIIRDVFGRDPCAISRHSKYTAPHIFPVAAKMGLPYLYGYPAAPPRYSISWYGGALNFAWTLVPDQPALVYKVGDHSWSDDDLFEDALIRLDQHLDQCETERQPFTILYLGHPYRVRSVESVEYWQYVNGENIPREQWGQRGGPRLRTDAQMATARRNIQRMAEYVGGLDRLNVLSVPEAAEKYGFQPHEISTVQLLEAAADIVRYRAEYAPDPAATQGVVPLDIPVGGRFSPAEVVVGLAESLMAYVRGGGLPDGVKRRDVLGPIDNPIVVPEVSKLKWRDCVAYLDEFLREVDRSGYLPANIGPSGARVGLGSLYRVAAELYLGFQSSQQVEEIALPRYPRYPRIGRSLGQQFATVVDNDMVDPDLNPWPLFKHGCLQSWTLKPAWALAE